MVKSKSHKKGLAVAYVVIIIATWFGLNLQYQPTHVNTPPVKTELVLGYKRYNTAVCNALQIPSELSNVDQTTLITDQLLQYNEMVRVRFKYWIKLHIRRIQTLKIFSYKNISANKNEPYKNLLL